MTKGKFIVFEGIDGSGKSTQIKKAVSFLFDQNKENDVYLTREPTRAFSCIRESMSNENINNKPEWYLDMFVKDRVLHLENTIIPNLNKGVHVLCDRYKYSTLAYQYAQGIPIDKIIKIHEGILIPDLILIFDCDPEVAYNRIKNNTMDSFDKNKNLQSKVRENYLKLITIFPKDNIKIINSNNSIEFVEKEVQKYFKELFL